MNKNKYKNLERKTEPIYAVLEKVKVEGFVYFFEKGKTIYNVNNTKSFDKIEALEVIVYLIEKFGITSGDIMEVLAIQSIEARK